MIKTIDEMKEYLVRELNSNLQSILEGVSSEYVIFHQGKANAYYHALANLHLHAKVEVKLEETEI